MATRHSRFIPLSLILGLTHLVGCAAHEFNIIEPVEFRQHIGHAKETVLPVGPLEYHFVAVEDRLVIRIFNSGSEAVKFVSEQSSLVDPAGMSHAMRPLMIPPGSHMKLILPPEARLEQAGPRVGFGFGYGYAGPGWADGFGYDRAIWNEPNYVAVYDNGEPPWDWPEGGQVRVLFTFQKGTDKPFSQAWVFNKQKM